MVTLPEFITFTGVDEHTQPGALEVIEERYPVEWAALLSVSKAGKEPRYPTLSFLKMFVNGKGRRAIHLCGEAAWSFNEGTVSHEIYEILRKATRVQINMMSEEYNLDAISKTAAHFELTAVIQQRRMIWPAFFPPNVEPLFDLSGGNGKEARFFPPQPTNYPHRVGYAGGLNAGNIALKLRSLEAHRYWMDMETGVRTQDWFDPRKCREVLEEVYAEP